MRQHVFDERVAATRDDRFAVCGGHRFGRNAKWQLGEHQSAERLARYVDTFPEGGGTEENCPARLTEAGEQCISSILAMHEQRPATLGAAGAELGGHRSHVAVAGEQDEHAAVGSMSKVDRHAHGGLRMSGGIDVRRGDIGSDRKERLLAISKGRRKEPRPWLDIRLSEAEAAGEKAKVRRGCARAVS